MATDFFPRLDPVEEFTPGIYANVAAEGNTRFAVPIFLAEGGYSGTAIVFGGNGEQFVQKSIDPSRSFRIPDATFTVDTIEALKADRSGLQEGCLGPIAGRLALLCKDHFGDAEWLFVGDGLFHDLRDNRFYFDSWRLTTPTASGSEFVLFEKKA